jgi:hypothetical protein
MTTPTPTLSPAAEAVLDAANRFSSYGPDDCLNESRFIVAAALRAAADQVVPEEQEPVPNEDSVIEMQIWSAIAQRQRTRTQLLAIADELEAQPEPVQPAQNCCLDDSLSACVFDDSSERIEDCDFASALYDQGQPKTECYYYRAALEAQPEPVGPTDDEIDALVICIQALPAPSENDLALQSIDQGRGMVRQALARWGRPAIQPIPVSERLPGAEDCDAEERCWWWIVDDPGQFPYWICAPVSASGWAGYTHWLPFQSLPIPRSEEI